MAYFLKINKCKTRTSLSICESFYNPVKKESAQKCYQGLGSVESQKAKGIADPIAYYRKVVAELNYARKQEKPKQITETLGYKYFGYFPLKSILEKLEIPSLGCVH